MTAHCLVQGGHQNEDKFTTSSAEPLLDPASHDHGGSGAEKVSSKSPTTAPLSVWRRSLCPLGSYCCCQIAYQAIFANLVLYLKRIRHEDNASAATIVTTVLGTGFCTSFLGAFLSDGYLGRLWSSVLILTLLFLGCTLLSIITQLQIELTAFFTFSLFLAGIGYGWFKPGLAALGGDQFDVPQERNSFYNHLFVVGTIGEIFALTVVTYLENSGQWALGFWICTAAVGIGVLFLVSMRRVQYRARENPFLRILQVLVAATRKVEVEVPLATDLLFEPEPEVEGGRRIAHTQRFRFLDKAATITDGDLARGGLIGDPWHLCTVTQVEEVKCLARILPFWCTLLFKAAAMSQLTTLFVEQGDAMDPYIGQTFRIAPGSMTLFNMLARIAFATLYDSIFVPLFKRATGRSRGPTSLQQIGTGFVALITAMVVAAMVEMKRLEAAKGGEKMSILWLIPQYAFEGIGLVCGVVGEADFFYSGATDGVKSLGSSLPVLSRGLGSYVSSVVVVVVSAMTTRGGGAGWIADDLDDGHLDYFFLLMAALMAAAFAAFLALAHGYRYPQEEEEEEEEEEVQLKAQS